ncbi:hypothetical protein [Halorarum halobium]|uniref:hypothetical protein n=1 Tax=Halorarum halobium TaxID=3075121 RepID=UPI0028A99C95|nr:hypothetical protein [Halobaculum sp. XH14]
MNPVRRGLSLLAALRTAVVSMPRRLLERTWAVLTDDGVRPALLFLIAMALAAASFGTFLVRGGGDPTRLEIGLQFGSLGIVFYMSLRQAGTAPR